MSNAYIIIKTNIAHESNIVLATGSRKEVSRILTLLRAKHHNTEWDFYVVETPIINSYKDVLEDLSDVDFTLENVLEI